MYPYEIKKTSNSTTSIIKNFNILKDTNKKIETGGIICCYDKLIHLDDNNYIIPLSSVINIQEKKWIIRMNYYNFKIGIKKVYILWTKVSIRHFIFLVKYLIKSTIYISLSSITIYLLRYFID